MTSVLTVYFDGGCPLCRKEIAFWRRRNGADRIDWIDLTEVPGAFVTEGLSKDDAIKRFHVQTHEGRLYSGARAFAALWSVLPATRIAGWIMGLPVIVQVMELVYRGFLKIRPLWRPHRCVDGVCDL